jgi:hypothetical protein
MDLKRSGPTSLPLAERKNVGKQTGKTAEHNRHHGMTQAAKQKVGRHPFADRLTISSRCNRQGFRCRRTWADFELGSPDYQEKVLSKTFYRVYPPHSSPPSLGTGFPRLIEKFSQLWKGRAVDDALREEECGAVNLVCQECGKEWRSWYKNYRKSQYSRILGFQLRPYLQASCWFQLILYHMIKLIAFCLCWGLLDISTCR